jgi:hypothetical protein
VSDRLRIAVITVVEVAALAIWLTFVREDAGIFRAETSSTIIGVSVLAAGITIEHLLAYNVINRRPPLKLGGLPVGRKLVVSLIETGIWALWLTLAETNALAAALVLGVLLIFEHTFSDNVFRDRGVFSRLVDVRTVRFSIVEAAGAAVWLGSVAAGQQIAGIAVLLITSFVEHTMAVNLARKRTASA